MNIQKQVRKLLAYEFFTNFSPAGAIWVLLLTTRGFTLGQVGLCEAFFHVVSLCCEVPSGMAADVFGRRCTLIFSRLVSAAASFLMIFSRGMGSICLAMGLLALSYNLASGTREAITYESLLQAGAEEGYLKLSAVQSVIDRVASAAATLSAGAMVAMGYKGAYALDTVVCLIALGITVTLTEPEVENRRRVPEEGIAAALGRCAREAVTFLGQRPRVGWVMLWNAGIGAGAVLLGFYLQDRLPKAGAAPTVLGALLLAVQMGGLLGSWAAPWLGKLRYKTAGVLCAGVVLAALGLVATGYLPGLVAGGVLACAGCDCLEILTGTHLNKAVPSAQRATLISVSSMMFSVVMMVLCIAVGGIA